MREKMAKKRSGLGRGLDSLIPVIEDEEVVDDQSSSKTLEDILEGSDEKKEDSENLKEEKFPENLKDTESTSSKDESSEIFSDKNAKVKVNEVVSDEKAVKVNETDRTVKVSEVVSDEKAVKVNETDRIVNTTNGIVSDEVVKTEDIKTHTNDEIATNMELTAVDDEVVDEDININEVLEIIEKNPRITLWSARSAAVLRYLRKTRPEFSISKEASELIDEAVSKKYPEIWDLFDNISNSLK
jgi:hypothetical protein